jgi:arylsulfatase A-like enzyme
MTERSMKKLITRRDFLRLTGMLPLCMAAPRLIDQIDAQADLPNVIIIVFDALSAGHISLGGYPRETMPNLIRIADRAVVYHNHYATANFTSPGTASLLTGTLPWTHRAFEHLGTVAKKFVEHNLFSAFQNHFRITYTHNPWADILLEQFVDNLESYIPIDRFLLANDKFIRTTFNKDRDIASLSWKRIINRKDDHFAYSLYGARLHDRFLEKKEAELAHLKRFYPRGIPGLGNDNSYLLEETIDGLCEFVINAQKPFVSYFHLLPPHAPYRTHREFYRYFEDDGYVPVNKPTNIFHQGNANTKLAKQRTSYDESILYVDREFGRFYEKMKKSGLLQNTWLVFTSDHGELFERGIVGHRTPVLYEPVVRVPLMIFEPGRSRRMDIYKPTSAVDLLPTLLHVTRQPEAAWTEGKVLPPFSRNEMDLDRSIYFMECSESKKNSPLDVATVSLRKGKYKLTYYFGYKKLGSGIEKIELYDIEDDPEELEDLSLTKKDVADEMLMEIRSRIDKENQIYS